MERLKEKNKTMKLVYAALCLALALVLPFLTGQIPQVGSMLCPMHLPVILAGFMIGGPAGAAVGFVAPLLRFVLFGMPPIFPTGVAMAFELATYAFVAGLLYKKLPRKKINIYVALIVAMICGRIIWGLAMTVIMGVTGGAFGWAMFIGGAIINALPGIAVQIVLIPLIVMALEKARLI